MVGGVVIPAGGASSRMHSITNGAHKALLPLGGRPIIDHVIEEVVDAGFRRITVVVPADDDSLEVHLKRAARFGGSAHVSILAQEGAGVSSAILEGARDLGCERLLVVWCDEVFLGVNRSAEIVRASEHFKETVISLRNVPQSARALCGMADAVRIPGYDRYFRVAGIREKPQEHEWDGDMASIGGYVISERVLDALARLRHGSSGDVPLSAALDVVARDSSIIGVEIAGSWFDCGSPGGYGQAVSAFAGA